MFLDPEFYRFFDRSRERSLFGSVNIKDEMSEFPLKLIINFYNDFSHLYITLLVRPPIVTFILVPYIGSREEV